MSNSNKLNTILKDRRIELKLTMSEIAKIVGVSEGTESGEIENMKRDKIIKLSKALQISPGVIMGWEDMPIIRLTLEEEKLINKYRENPQMHDAIKKLLGL